MFRKNSTFTYSALTVLGIGGAWLTGLFTTANPAGEVSAGELMRSFLGFLLLVGAISGILVTIRRNQKPIDSEELSKWEEVRKKGRSRYLKNLIARGIIVGLLAIVWPLVSDYRRTGSVASVGESLWIYLSIFLICVFGMYYGGIRTWNNYEAIIQKRLQLKLHKDAS